ncbi:hypothetical protein JCM11641_007522 [Rhodosporidiobolus odoratus]
MATDPRWVFETAIGLSALSVVGGLAIAGGWWVAPQRQALRQKLVLGLGLTDLLQACVTLAGNGLELTGHPYNSNSSSCLASGFMYQTCVIAGAAWTLLIALTTYITLVHPFSSLAAFLERPVAFPLIALAVLLIGITPSIPATIIYDIVDAGGVCWLPTGTLEGNLYLFIPRAATFVLVIGLYLRLFIFFRTRDLKLLETTTDYEEEEDGRRGSHRLSVANLSVRLTNWNDRRASDGSRPPFPRAASNPAPTPLSPIPGSPAIPFTTPFSTEPPTPQPPQQPVAIAFPTSSESPHSEALDSPTTSADSTSMPDTYGASSYGIKQPTRPSSVAFPTNTTPTERHKDPIPKRHRPLSPAQMNKRLSILMLVYPMAYCILVALALARLIQSFSRDNAPAHHILRYVSRFCIFAQGAIDGMLFVVVSVVFKYWTRRDS